MRRFSFGWTGTSATGFKVYNRLGASHSFNLKSFAQNDTQIDVAGVSQW